MADNIDETIVDDGAAAVEIAQEEIAEGSTDVELNSPEGAANTEPDNVPNDVTRTQEFSRRLNDLSGRKVDEFISGLGWVNPYTEAPIKTQAEYNEFLSMQKAAETGKDPVTESRITGLENQLRQYREAEEDRQLENDPFYGQYYARYKDDVHGVLNLAKQQGMNVGVKEVFNTILLQKLPEIMTQQRTDVTAETVKNVVDKAKASPGSIGGESYEQKLGVADMNDEQFNNLYKRVMRGERVVL